MKNRFINKGSRLVFYLSLVALLFTTILLFADTRLTIERERAVLREGAGSFYDIVTELPVGSQVNKTGEEDDWFQVTFGRYNGFLSPRMTQKTPPRQSALAGMRFEDSSADVSQHAMSAGVKGFGERFTKTFNGDPSFLESALTYQMDVRQYRLFRRETHRAVNIRRIRRSVPLPPKDVPDYYTLAEEGLGLGIAARIASVGIYRNPTLHEYVNQVGNVVVEASDVFDNTFKFFILDIDNPNAYATPGGVIFITRGMLNIIDNEAELALVLGHEIAHASRFHGVIELEARREQIAAEDAFADMDSFFDEFLPDAISKETKDLIEEMEELSFQIFETLIQGRLDEYEEEADYLAMIYSIRAGYAPQGMISLLQRLISSGTLSNNEHYTPEINRIRIEKMTENLRRMNVPKGLQTHRDRFQRHKRAM